MKVNRREFMRRVGMGSIALGSLPALMDLFKMPALAQGERGVLFLAVTAAGEHRLILGGAAWFDPSKGPASAASGGGMFTHFQAVGNPPLPLVASGTWNARLLTSYREIGTYGGTGAGNVDLVVDLQRVRPSPALIRGGVLRVFCNLGPIGANTGEIEGYTLSIPGTDFSAGGTPGPFRQVPPGGLGVTILLLPESRV